MDDRVVRRQCYIFKDVLLPSIKSGEIGADINELEGFDIARTFPTCLSAFGTFRASFVTLEPLGLRERYLV